MSSFAALSNFVRKHPLAIDAWHFAERWQNNNGGFPESVTGDVPAGDALADFGDIIPYLWLVDAEKAAAFAAHADDTMLIDRSGRVYAFDNHDFVFGSWLYAQITGIDEWTHRFREQTQLLCRMFFRGKGLPPQWAVKPGSCSVKGSAFGLAILELAALDDAPRYLQLAQRTAQWLLEQPYLPVREIRYGFFSSPDLRKDKLRSRLFKETTNSVAALRAFNDRLCDFAAEELMAKAASLFFQTPWGTTELWDEGVQKPSLLAATAATDFLRSGIAAGYKEAVALSEATYERLLTGDLRHTPDSPEVHLDILVDAVTAYALQYPGDRRLLDLALTQTERHKTRTGYTTFDSPDAPIVTKYNFLVLKLAILDFLMQPETADLGIASDIEKVFLLDR